MITIHTISASRRRLLFMAAAAADLTSRFAAMSFQVDSVLFGGSAPLSSVVSVVAETGLAIPVVAAPVVLSPVAYVLGQIFVLTESHYVRVVSGAFFVGSFLLYGSAAGVSLLLAVLAYLVLASGMLRSC